MSDMSEESLAQKIANIELFQAKSSEAFSMMAKSLAEMNEKLNVVLEILNTFSIMISEDDEDEDYDDDEVEDYGDYDDDDDENDDGNNIADSDETWMPNEREFWERENDDD